MGNGTDLQIRLRAAQKQETILVPLDIVGLNARNSDLHITQSGIDLNILEVEPSTEEGICDFQSKESPEKLRPFQ